VAADPDLQGQRHGIGFFVVADGSGGPCGDVPAEAYGVHAEGEGGIRAVLVFRGAGLPEVLGRVGADVEEDEGFSEGLGDGGGACGVVILGFPCNS
jgi:hypothetical protein